MFLLSFLINCLANEIPGSLRILEEFVVWQLCGVNDVQTIINAINITNTWLISLPRYFILIEKQEKYIRFHSFLQRR